MSNIFMVLKADIFGENAAQQGIEKYFWHVVNLHATC